MALHTKKQFANITGITTRELSVYISRKKVIMSGEYIDDTNQTNAEFLEIRAAKRGAENNKSKSNYTGDEVANDEYDSDEYFEGEGLGSVLTKLKHQQYEKLKVDTRLQELKEQKIRGEVVPIELMKGMFITHDQSILTSYKDALEEMLINISVEAKLSGEQLARLRGKMITSLNSAIKRAKDSTAHDLKRLIEEFSIKKEVGEHE